MMAALSKINVDFMDTVQIGFYFLNVATKIVLLAQNVGRLIF